MSNNDDCKMSPRDYATAALMNIQDARYELGDANIKRADEHLSCAQRQAFMAGAKDIGPLADARDLSDPYKEYQEMKREKRKGERGVEELEETVEVLKENLEEERDRKKPSVLNRLRRMYRLRKKK